MARGGKLSRNDRDRAVRLAAEFRSVRALGEQAQPVSVAPLLRARNRTQAPSRAVVGIHDYRRNRSMAVVVDLDAGKAIAAAETPARFQLSESEIKAAERLAGRDPSVRSFLRGRPMDPLTRLYFPPAGRGHDRGHRFAIVFLRPTKSERRYAVVDLSIGAVTEVLGPEHLRKE